MSSCRLAVWDKNLLEIIKSQRQQGVCHTVALLFTLKKYLKAKRRIMETQIVHHAKNIIL
jgi:hypothetical protein